MDDLEEVAKSFDHSYWRANSLDFKNVPDILINSIAKSCSYSNYYAEDLHFQNVPIIIIKSITTDTHSFNKYIKKINPVNQLLPYIIKYDRRFNICKI